MELCSVPRFLVRLKSVALRHTFDATLERVRAETKMFRQACEEVTESKKLRKLLEVVLKVGNYVNGSTPRGGAWGFKLDTLAKFETVKANDGKPNDALPLRAFLHRLLISMFLSKSKHKA